MVQGARGGSWSWNTSPIGLAGLSISERESMNAVFACSNHWRSAFQVGSHHIARGLARRGWNVAYVSDPISPLHLRNIFEAEFQIRLDAFKRGGVSDGRVWAMVPGGVVTPFNAPLLRSQWVLNNWHRFVVPRQIHRSLRERGFDHIDLLYLDSVRHFGWAQKLAARNRVYRIADANHGFANWTAALDDLERQVANAVDLVTYAAPNLRSYVAELAPRESMLLPNGVDYSHFHSPASPPSEYQSLRGRIVVYAGAMAEWFNFALVNSVVSQLPDVTFVLIGPSELARRRLTPRPNLLLLGPRPFAVLPQYLQHADVGIIPFDVDRFPQLVQSVNPLKLYEYMAAGLPVVATDWRALRDIASPAALTNDSVSFATEILRIAPTKGASKYSAFSAGHDWNGRVSQMLGALRLA
jgi:glycosyltransferase involved in cell wall biosynthesis